MVSADDWARRTDALETPLALQVTLLKHSYVFPWSQFLYAEGGNDEVRLTFTTHDVLVKGSSLNVLLTAISAHGVALIQEPTRLGRFTTGAGPYICEISVNKIEQN
jgi:hypothetical protein